MDSKTARTLPTIAALAACLVMLPVLPVAAQNQIAYSNDFSRGVGGGSVAPGVTAMWSHGAVEVTPSGRYGPFLGRFGNDAVTLSLTGLPEHSSVIVSVKLFIIRTWDGNHTDEGPDFWEFGVGGGLGLLRTTFANYGFLRQSYPGQYPSSFMGCTGALEVNTLGYDDPGDAVYVIGRSVAHRGSSLALYFRGSNLQGLGDESWGLDDVSVAVIRR